MSSFIRNLQRKRLRAKPDYEPREQPTVTRADGSYRTLRPTKGWIYISAARLRAQFRLAAIKDHVLPERTRRPAKIWRTPAPVPPSTETRQQRRARQRGC